MRWDFRLFLRIALRITSQHIIIGRTHLTQGGLIVIVGSFSNSEFTQRDSRKKRTANHLCVTNVTRL